MSEQHTPEPWRTDAKGGFPQDVHDADDNLVAACSEANFGDANARRIVVCVNACAGIETGELERGKAIAEFDYMKLMASRDDLLAALVDAREALQFANDSPGGGISDTIWMMHRPETLFDFIDAAIASVKETP